MWRIGSIEANDVVIMVLNPNPSQEASTGVVFGLYVQHQAADFADELLPHKLKIVVILLEIPIKHDHLSKADR